jgi:hypothetical protein
VTQRGPGLWDEVCSPKMQWWSLLALADLSVINSPHTHRLAAEASAATSENKHEARAVLRARGRIRHMATPRVRLVVPALLAALFAAAQTGAPRPNDMPPADGWIDFVDVAGDEVVSPFGFRLPIASLLDGSGRSLLMERFRAKHGLLRRNGVLQKATFSECARVRWSGQMALKRA